MKAGNWRQLFSLCHRLNVPRSGCADLARQMAHQLRSMGRHQEAAGVLLDYGHANSSGGSGGEDLLVTTKVVEYLLEGRLWSEADRQIHRIDNQHDRIKLTLHNRLIQSLRSALESAHSDLNEISAQFDRHRLRLTALREQNTTQSQLAAQMAAAAGLDSANGAGGGNGVEVFPDSQSMATFATTMATSSATFSSKLSAITAATKKTSKARRKFERRKLASKEGSVFEEDYLLDSLRKLIIQWRSIRGTEYFACCEFGMITRQYYYQMICRNF